MSLHFSDTVNKNGIIQRIEQECGFNDGDLSGNATQLSIWTGSVNLALDRLLALIFQSDGRWQFDDSNHTKNPVIYTDLVANQRVYNFTTDQQSNLILDIYSVYARTSATGAYYLLNPVDAQSDVYPQAGHNDVNFYGSPLTDGLGRTGYPTSYDKTGNGIKLDFIPSATVSNGLQIFINREASYFATSDTTKSPGIAGLFHEYCVLEPAYRFSRSSGLKNQETLKRDVLEMEKAITKYYARRSKDERPIMSHRRSSFI